jgi:hypothetical protein
VSKNIILRAKRKLQRGWNWMTNQMLKTFCKTVKDEKIGIVYHLSFRNALYSLECYREGLEGQKNYCYIENLTDDEGEAEAFLQLIAKGKVFPVHIRDLAEDYFGIE